MVLFGISLFVRVRGFGRRGRELDDVGVFLFFEFLYREVLGFSVL